MTGELFKFLVRRWGELFGAKFDVLLYDLTSNYFETDEDCGPDDLRQFGYSRQVVIALIVTPEGFQLSYEVMGGGTAGSTTLSGFLDRFEHRYGRANRIWVMDPGVPTEDSQPHGHQPGALWTFYIQLTEVEQAFKEIKHDLGVGRSSTRPRSA